jgi:hypothetical protein
MFRFPDLQEIILHSLALFICKFMHRDLGRRHGAWVSAGESINCLRRPMEADSYCHWRDDMGSVGYREAIHSQRQGQKMD